MLGCRPPDAFTRVSEYMNEIIDYVRGILDAGFAYESNSSVYFNTQQYRYNPRIPVQCLKL